MATLDLTEREINAPGAQQMMDGGVRTAMPPTVPTAPTAPTPTTPTGTGAATPAPEPTVGEQLSGIQSEALRIKDILDQRAAEEAAAGISFNMPTLDGGVADLPEEVDADAINRSTLKMFQDQIDATNQVYDQLLGEARLEGEGRLGSGRAMAARGGLLGSDFAASQKSKIQDFNTQEQRSIQAERTAAIGAILGTARAQAQQEIAAKRAARQQGYENYRQYLADGQNRRLNNVSNIAQAFIAQGIDPATLDEQELNAIATEAGVEPGEIINQIRVLEAGETGEQFTLSKDQVRYDAAGNIIAEGPSGPRILKEGDVIVDDEGNVIQKIPKTYKPGTGGGGTGSFSNTDEQTLLGGGWNESQISQLAEGVRQYGLSEVLEQEKKAGATDAQLRALQSVYGVEPGSAQTITRENIAKLWGLADTGEDANKWWFGEQNEKEAIDSLMEEVEVYRNAGYTDKEILEIML